MVEFRRESPGQRDAGPQYIPGTKIIYTLQPGEDWAFYKDSIIVIHPDRHPKIVHLDGTIEELKCG